MAKKNKSGVEAAQLAVGDTLGQILNTGIIAGSLRVIKSALGAKRKKLVDHSTRLKAAEQGRKWYHDTMSLILGDKLTIGGNLDVTSSLDEETLKIAKPFAD